MKDASDGYVRRNGPSGIIAKVEKSGRIKLETATRILELIAEMGKLRVFTWRAHLAIEVNTGPMLKTIDNEEDAQETVRRLEAGKAKHVASTKPQPAVELKPGDPLYRDAIAIAQKPPKIRARTGPEMEAGASPYVPHDMRPKKPRRKR